MNFLQVDKNSIGKDGVQEMALMNNNKKEQTSKWTEDWVPVEGIQNGMILTSDRMKVAGVKVFPRNIFILDQNSQDNILISLKNFYNMIDFEFWLVVADRPVDISVYLSQLQLLYNDTSSPAIKKLIMQDIQKGQTFINNNIVDTEYYILFKEVNDDDVQKKIRLLINGLASCGLNSAQANNDDLRVILDNFLNGGETTEFGAVMPL